MSQQKQQRQQWHALARMAQHGLTREDMRGIVSAAMKRYADVNGSSADESEMRRTASFCVAALGDHCSLEDRPFYALFNSVAELGEKEQARWRWKLDVGNGTNQRIVFRDGMLRMKRCGCLIPILPQSISAWVSADGNQKKYADEMAALSRPRAWEQREAVEHAIHLPPPPPPVPEDGDTPKSRPSARRARVGTGR